MIEKLKTLAAQLPSGLNDPRAPEKLEREWGELLEAMIEDDTLGAILEAGDVAYYAVKAWATGLAGERERDRVIAAAARVVRLTPAAVLTFAIAKFSLRARPGNPKDDIAERAAVIRAFADFAGDALQAQHLPLYSALSLDGKADVSTVTGAPVLTVQYIGELPSGVYLGDGFTDDIIDTADAEYAYMKVAECSRFEAICLTTHDDLLGGHIPRMEVVGYFDTIAEARTAAMATFNNDPDATGWEVHDRLAAGGCVAKSDD